ncbi:MAG: glycoside hydrolase family 13 [Ignavibacteriae bacterium HGW-Ignavibacteriae-2]|jgi:1,4-alpha-glucan branching enzyme|nr:MAG: glycoside hydrolase family 13 [Ignavibacteriae bacterium HGW-Ignavibacteriae-2]
MAITKKYSDDKKFCHVTFSISKETADKFNQISLVGEFNNWDIHKNKFTIRNTDGSLSVAYNLPAGKEYQFRYLGDGQIWFNEPEADSHVLSHYGDSENSILQL